MLRRLNPRDVLELQLVEQIISASWRIRRIRRAERIAYASVGDALTDESPTAVRPNAFDVELQLDAQIAEQQLQDPREPSAGMVMLAMHAGDEQGRTLDRLHRYERRLEQTMHRCLGQLHKLREEPQEGLLSEFAAELLDREDDETLAEQVPPSRAESAESPGHARADASSEDLLCETKPKSSQVLVPPERTTTIGTGNTVW
jgi:hypothetical protein